MPSDSIVITPTSGVDPRDALATSMFAAPGVYAVLVGSGVSTEAGILTGQRIMEDLIRRVARNRGIEDPGEDPVSWWEKATGERPRWDGLLESLASTDEARRSLLRGYFELGHDSAQPIMPTAAHEALAKLCAAGEVRVVLTTNFDRLIERALDMAGMSPQVLTTDAAMASRTPFVHAPVTVVKLHGDYLAPGLRNTEKELAKYEAGARDLLRQVFDEYGLVIIGWSAEWDRALVAAIEASPSRRYPTFWASYRGELTESARRLIANRQAYIIDTSGAAELLPDLVERTERLGRIAARPKGLRPTRRFSMHPNTSVPPGGWAAMPLLIVRVATLTQLDRDVTVGLIGPAQRRRLVEALYSTPFTSVLRTIAELPAGSALGEPLVAGQEIPEPLTTWTPCAEYQSLGQARYQLGGDGTRGVSAIVDVALPRQDTGGTVTFTVDVGISLQEALTLGQIVQLFRDGLVATTAALPDSLDDMLPVGARAEHCELHLLASPWDGVNQGTRANDIRERIDFRWLEAPTGPSPQTGFQLGFAADVGGALTTAQALDLALYAIQWMALENGFLDPAVGLRSLYVSFGRWYDGG